MDSPSILQPHPHRSPFAYWKAMAFFALGSLVAMAAFYMGRSTIASANTTPANSQLLSTDLGSNALPSHLPPEILKAAASHGSANMAIATGPVSEDAEGVFFLDYLTGDLQCWVYYPRNAAFAGKFAGNVRGQLPSGKNPEYLMVTGAISPGPTTTNTRQGACLLYVFDVNEGVFAAYAVPWTRAAESAMQPQSGNLVPVGGGQIRAPLPVKK